MIIAGNGNGAGPGLDPIQSHLVKCIVGSNFGNFNLTRSKFYPILNQVRLMIVSLLGGNKLIVYSLQL